MGYSPWDHKESDTTELLTLFFALYVASQALSNLKAKSVQSVPSLSHVRLFETHGLQHARLPCLLPALGACSNLCPSSQ